MTTIHAATNPQNKMIPLDFKSIEEVPDSHAWPELTNETFDFSSGDENGKLSIPVIDFTAPNVVELIGHACESYGIFQIINHGVPLSLFDDVEAQARRLFALPKEEKVKVLRSPEGASSGYGVSQLTPWLSKFLWHEGFTIMGSAVQHAKVLWPHDHELFCDVMDDCQKKLKDLGHQVFLLMLKFFNVSQEELKWTSSSANTALLLNSYPSCPNPKVAMGSAPHTDSLLFNILHQKSKGLQIFQEEAGGWITVPPVDGALVFTVGDLLHILSNARFPSVLHRAIVNQNQHRISIAYAYGPPFDVQVGPLSGLPSPCFRSLTVGEFLYLKEEHRDKIFSAIRI